MRSLLVISLSVSILSTFMPGVQIAATFDPERLQVLDRHGTSILVRGNAPLNRQGSFDPEMIVDYIQRNFAAESNNCTFDRLHVISLISASQSDESYVLRKQEKYVQEETTKHKLYHRPIVGSWISPPPFPHLDFLNHLIWNFWRPDDGAWELTNELKYLLLESQNTILYVHCMRGIDRTGLVAGTYMTRWKGDVSVMQIHQMNHDVGKREMNWPARNALRWVLWKSSS